MRCGKESDASRTLGPVVTCPRNSREGEKTRLEKFDGVCTCVYVKICEMWAWWREGVVSAVDEMWKILMSMR